MNKTCALLWLLMAVAALAAEPPPVKLGAGQPAPYAGYLLTRVRLARLSGKAAALQDLQAALAARTRERDAEAQRAALQAKLAGDYKAEADRAVLVAGAARAHGRVRYGQGLVTGIGIGHLAVKAIGWLLHLL